MKIVYIVVFLTLVQTLLMSSFGAAPAPPTPTVDAWALAGHGVSRSLYSSSSSTAWTLSLAVEGAKYCRAPVFATPFSWWDYAAGAVMSDSTGTLYIPLECETSVAVWAVNPDTGAQFGFGSVEGTYLDSYARILPDGSLVMGVDSTRVVVVDGTSLKPVSNVTGLVQGPGGAEVIAIYKSLNGRQQIATAGGDGGSDWWGAACDIVGNKLTKCAITTDSTVCVGADGVTAYNNQRFENPNGAVRYNLPFPSDPLAFNSNYVQWPWWIRSDLSGNAYVYDGEYLTKFNSKTTQQWQDTYWYYMGLMLTDDESTIILTNTTTITTVNPKTGQQIKSMIYSDLFSTNYVQCGTVLTPWQNGMPIPLSDNTNAILICENTEKGSFFSAIYNFKTGTASQKTTLTVMPSQVVVDNAGNIYSIGVSNKVMTVQKIPYSTSE